MVKNISIVGEKVGRGDMCKICRYRISVWVKLPCSEDIRGMCATEISTDVLSFSNTF